MVMTFVVAGNYQQAWNYARLNELERWRFVANPQALWGYTIKPEEVKYVGTYYERRDWPEIEEVLAVIFARNRRVI